MTKRPTDYNGKTYYPTRAKSCLKCEFYKNISCQEFRAQVNTNSNACWDSNGNNGVIWRTSDAAKLQHLTERLTT